MVKWFLTHFISSSISHCSWSLHILRNIYLLHRMGVDQSKDQLQPVVHRVCVQGHGERSSGRRWTGKLLFFLFIFSLSYDQIHCVLSHVYTSLFLLNVWYLCLNSLLQYCSSLLHISPFSLFFYCVSLSLLSKILIIC